MTRLDRLFDLAEKLMARISDDTNRHGGLLTGETQRASDELRVEMSRFRKDSKDETEHQA